MYESMVPFGRVDRMEFALYLQLSHGVSTVIGWVADTAMLSPSRSNCAFGGEKRAVRGFSAYSFPVKIFISRIRDKRK